MDPTKHKFWAMLFINFYAVTSKILTPDDSCLCIPAHECSGDSQFLHTNRQGSSLPCSDENLIRCCSIIGESIQSAEATRSLQNISESDQPAEESKGKEDLIEESTQFMENVTSHVTYVDESLAEYSTTESLTTESPLEEMFSPTTQISTYSNIMNVKDEEDRNAGLPISSTDKIMVSTNAKLQKSLGQREDQLRYLLNWKQLLEPRPIRVRIINESSTTPLSTVRFPQTEEPVYQPDIGKEKQENLLDTEEQELITRLLNFESTKTSKVSYPKKRLAPEIKETIEEKETRLVGKIRRLFPRKAILDNNYRMNVNFKYLSAPKSVSKKTNNLLKRKTSLDASLTLDRVSTQAINKNAKPLSKLSRPRNHSTSIRNLSYPEGTGNIKHVV